MEVPVRPPPRLAAEHGTRLAEFELGRRVTAQSGCLACHRIATAGNRGPGRDLTRIGRMLSRARIEHAILDASAPMPSFGRLPHHKLRALVTFLTLLR